MYANQQEAAAGGLLSQAGAPNQAPEGPPEDDLFTRTVLAGVRKVYYGENPQQVFQMIQAGSTPGQGIAMATIALLEMAQASLAEQGKDTPPELMFDPEGPAEYIIEDLSEMVAAEMGASPEQLEEEAEAAYAQNVGEALAQSPDQQAAPQGQPGLLAQATPAMMPDPTQGRM